MAEAKKAISQAQYKKLWQAAKNLISEATSVRYTITVSADGWDATGTEGTSNYYSNTVTISDITTDTRLCCIELADDYKDNADAGAAYRQWSELDTATGKVTFYSKTKPTSNFAIVALEAK